MGTIYESDTIPTIDDERVASVIMTNDNGDIDNRKVANEVCRQRRVQGHHGKMLKSIDDTCRIILTKTEAAESEASKNKASQGDDETKELSKYIYMGIGIISTLVFLIPLIWDSVFNEGVA